MEITAQVLRVARGTIEGDKYSNCMLVTEMEDEATFGEVHGLNVTKHPCDYGFLDEMRGVTLPASCVLKVAMKQSGQDMKLHVKSLVRPVQESPTTGKGKQPIAAE